MTRDEIVAGLAEILEEVAGVNPDDEVQNLKTVGDAVSYIVKAQA